MTRDRECAASVVISSTSVTARVRALRVPFFFFLSFLQKKFISMSFNFNLKNRFVSRVIIIGVKITRLDTNINNAEILLSHNNMAST